MDAGGDVPRDEFLYLVINPQGSENIRRIADTMLQTIGPPIDMGTLKPIVQASIGIAVYPDDGTTGEELIGNADTAMYRAKKTVSGRMLFDARWWYCAA